MVFGLLAGLEARRLVLASASPRRRELLNQLGLTRVEVVPSRFDESTIHGRDFPSPQAYVVHSAEQKAREVYARLTTGTATGAAPPFLVIGADTVISFEGRIIEKPRDAQHATQTLTELSGKQHAVLTGVALVYGPGAHDQECFHEETRVRFRELDPGLIAEYVSTGEPMDKAGAYGIQARGAVLVAGIEGDYNNVVGFPLSAFAARLPPLSARLEERPGAGSVDGTAAVREAAEHGQVSQSAAQVYEEFFVPALFQEWAGKSLDAAGVGRWEHVLDVACGTGVVTREAVRRVGTARVTGLDCNEQMLEVARNACGPGVDLACHSAEALPYRDGAFDVVVCNFGLMFFEDRVPALRELWRVTKPGSGRLVLAVWGSLEHTPGYKAMHTLLCSLFGPDIAAGLAVPYCLGDPALCRSLLDEAGIAAPRVETTMGTARFPSVAAWVDTDIKGWTLASAINEHQLQRLHRAAPAALARFVGPGGAVAFDAPAHLLVAAKPASKGEASL